MKETIKDETICTKQKVMAQLFGIGVPTMSKHLGHIFDEGGLNKRCDCVSKMEITTHHNAIIAIDYRVHLPDPKNLSELT